jgi:hypothetical protein
MISHQFAGLFDDVGEAPPVTDFHIFEDIHSVPITAFSWHIVSLVEAMEDRSGRDFGQIWEGSGRSRHY